MDAHIFQSLLFQVYSQLTLGHMLEPLFLLVASLWLVVPVSNYFFYSGGTKATFTAAPPLSERVILDNMNFFIYATLSQPDQSVQLNIGIFEHKSLLFNDEKEMDE